MKQKNGTSKSPMSTERIFTIITLITFAVAAVFLVKNLVNHSYQGAIAIGICLVIFGIMVLVMKKAKASLAVQQSVLSVTLVCLVLFISLNSGAYYSDDFPLFLALVALTGLYLEPKCTLIQTIAIDVALIIMYVVHPEKAESLSQYIMCYAIFNVAAWINFMVVRRGRAFIQMAFVRAAEAERLLESMKTVSTEVQRSYENSTRRMDDLQQVDGRLNRDTHNLERGSQSVREESSEVAQTCSMVQERMHGTEQKIEALNQEVKMVEEALEDSKLHMGEMDHQMQSINETMHSTNQIFNLLQQQMQEITKLTDQLGTIAFNTKILAINASIEAARAGQYGTGFAVVANEVQNLATESDNCSAQVTAVVENIRTQIEATTLRLGDSVQAIQLSLGTLTGLEEGFDGLIVRFQSLYQNIEEQNSNIIHMDRMFDELRQKVSDMSACSEENGVAVESIVDAMAAYKAQMNLLMEDTRQIQELSASMLQAAEA